LCCGALGGCGESGSEDRDDGEDGGSRRNIVVKTVNVDACLPRPLVADADGRTTRMASIEMSVVESRCPSSR